MKPKQLFFFTLAGVLLLLNHLLIAGAVIPQFEGKDGGNKVVLIWKSIVEVALDHYEIERSLDKISYIKIGEIKAEGPKTYEFIDKTVFKQTSHTFYYRLRLIDHDGKTSLFGKIITVKPNISGIRHTWGSLKAMFR